MTNESEDNIDELVQAGLDAGMSIRAIAKELSVGGKKVERGRVDRVVKRLQKQKRALEAAEREAEEPSSLQQQIDRIDAQIAAATDAGNDMRALRLARVRGTLVAQLEPEPEQDPDAAVWSRLTPAARSVFEHCIHVANGLPGNPYWTDLLARVGVWEDRPHPAHLPLPAGAPEGERMLVP